MYESYHSWLDGRLQQEALVDDFNYLWHEIQEKWFKFGRYSAYFYLQTLKETCGYSFDAPSLFLSDYSGSRSHRNGLIIGSKRYDWIDVRLDKGQYDWLESLGEEIRQEVGCSRFQLETMLCSYKKLARQRDSRYIGYYTDRQAEEIRKTSSDGWHGIDWSPWWDARIELDLSGHAYMKEQKQLNLFL